MKTFKNYALLLIIALAITSCNKDEDPTPQNTQISNPTPSFSDADGVLAAIQVISYQDVPFIGETAVYVDVASGSFWNSNNDLEDAGIVSVNTFDLQSLDNNAYVLPGEGSTSIDFDFSSSSGNSWTIGGGANVPNFSYTTNKRMPGDVKFAADYSSVDKSNDLTIQITTSPINTDSILFVLATNDKTLTKTVGPNVTSVTFSANEMNDLNGNGVVQVAAYNYELSVQTGKNYYFINESLVTTYTEF